MLQVEIQKLKKKSDEANMLIRASKVNSHCGVGQIGQYFSDGEYSNYLFYEVSKRFNNLLPEQNPTRYSEKQLEIY